MIDGKINPAIFAAQKKGILFDVGHGGGSFVFRTAVPAFKEGWYADTISTDMHINSMNAGMKDMLNVMSKFLALGMPLDQVIAKSTWAPARPSSSRPLDTSRWVPWRMSPSCGSRRAGSASWIRTAPGCRARRS